MLPGLGGHQLSRMKVDEREFDRIQAIILSMTPEERRNPDVIKGSRRIRIAQRLGHERAGREGADQTVRPDAEGDEGDVAGQDARHRGTDAAGPLSVPRRSSPKLRKGTVAVRLRLTRVGGQKDPIWRVVVADQRSPRDGRVIETIGHYNAQTEPSTIVLDEERVRALARPRRPAVGHGAQAAQTQGISAPRAASARTLRDEGAARVPRPSSSTSPTRSRSSSSRRTTARSCSSCPSPTTTTAR